MDRQHFLRTTGLSLAALLIGDRLGAAPSNVALIDHPQNIAAVIDGKEVRLRSRGGVWTSGDVHVAIRQRNAAIVVEVRAPRVTLSEITLAWAIGTPSHAKVMNDHWERTYGDVSWHAPAGSERLPWYFMVSDAGTTYGFGVRTGARSFCAWQVGGETLRLTMDTRSGGEGVQLGDRMLKAAELVAVRSREGESPFDAARRFMTLMCLRPRMPQAPVYGINDWYFTYGKNSEALIMEHTQRMAPLADGLTNRPFSVIDAGWYPASASVANDTCWGEWMDRPNGNFGAMDRLADRIRQAGMRPAIWTRPLCGNSSDRRTLLLPLIKGRRENKPVLDPTIPENEERIKRCFRLYRSWGYEMVKFDFTTFDLLGAWGFEMIKEGRMTEPGWSFHDASRTTAEIILGLYEAIRESVGATYLIGCNTVSHLSAGLFELNRIGDDNSGQDWARTRKMGVNTLAFRGMQHGSFYAADADCVGLTTKIPWEKNKQWMELLGRSGTPLFISAQAEATGEEQKRVIRESFRTASRVQPPAEPLDWMERSVPAKWKLNGEIVSFNWD